MKFPRFRTFTHAVVDNAMLYKDTSQWLRSRTFLILFFSLLAVAEGVSLFVMALGEELNRPGNNVFVCLLMVLLGFTLIVAGMGYGLTAREFQNRTFELYELSGMSLEKMVGGKLISMMYQFFFGFCCLVPFMFFAYFLGGLDFLDVISGALIILLIVPVLFLVSLGAALTSRLQQIATLGKAAGMVGGLLIAYFAVQMLFVRGPFGEIIQAMSSLLKELFALNWPFVWGVLIFLGFYLQICLLLFYLCCDTVSREADSRQIAVKVLCLTLMLSWMAFFAFMHFRVIRRYEREMPYFELMPIMVLLGLSGLMMFFSRLNPPVIVRQRYRNARGFKELFYWFFQPGPRGYLRYLILQLYIIAAYAFLMAWNSAAATVSMGYGITRWEVFLQYLKISSFVLQLPYFFAFPTGFVTVFFPKLRENVALQRVLLACWWGFAGATIGFYASWSYMYNRYNTGSQALLELIADLTSPFAAIIVSADNNSVLGESGSYLRIAVGFLGLYLMHGIIRRRTRDVAHTGNIQSSYAPTGAPA